MRLLFATLAIVSVLGVVVTILSTGTNEARSSNVPYQRVQAAIVSGQTIHLTDTVFDATQPASSTTLRHAWPERYTSQLWLTYTGDKVATQCSSLTDARGTVLQHSVYQAQAGQLITTYSDGTSESTTYQPYTSAQVERAISDTAGDSIDIGVPLAATERPGQTPSPAAQPNTSETPDSSDTSQAQPSAVPSEIEETTMISPSIREVHYYDGATGEIVGSERWDDSAKPSILLKQIHREISVEPSSPC
jgi:hypothetical protein